MRSILPNYRTILSLPTSDDATQCTIIPVGTHAFVHLIDVPLNTALPCETLIEYDLLITEADGAQSGIAEWAPSLLYGKALCPNFVLRSRVDQLLHSSCRKPHHPARNGRKRPTAIRSPSASSAMRCLLICCVRVGQQSGCVWQSAGKNLAIERHGARPLPQRHPG